MSAFSSEATSVETYENRYAPKGRFAELPESALPHSQVTALAQDSFGFLWIGTQGGLVRFDGHESIVVKTSDDDSWLGDNHITALAADPDGGVWVGTSDAGVFRFHSKNGSVLHLGTESTPVALEGKTVVALHNDSAGNLWVATTQGGVQRYSRSLEKLTTTFPTEEVVTAMAEREMKIFMGTSVGELLLLDIQSDAGAPESIAEVGSISALCFGEKNSLWIGSDEGGYRAVLSGDPTDLDLKKIEGLSDDHVSSVWCSSSEEVWIGTRGGLNRVESDGSLSIYRHTNSVDSSLPDDEITVLLQTVDQTLWIGTVTRGVTYLAKTAMTFSSQTLETTAMSLAQDGDAYWIGTHDRGLLRLDKNNVGEGILSLRDENTGDAFDLAGGWLMDVVRDSLGHIWVASHREGLLVFNPNSMNFRTFNPDNSELSTSEIFKLKEAGGQVYIGTVEGLYSASVDDWSKVQPPALPGLEDAIFDLAFESADGQTLWIAAGQGVIRYDVKDASLKKYELKSGGELGAVSILRDRSGRVWAGTYGDGLFLLNDETDTFEKFQKTRDFSDDLTVFGILEDAKGRLWLSTNGNCLLLLNEQRLASQKFCAESGVQGNEFAMGSATRLDDGRLFFGGIRGFNLFHGEDIDFGQGISQVEITTVSVGGIRARQKGRLLSGEQLELSYTDDILTIEFSAPELTGGVNAKYRYRLLGFSDKWIEVDWMHRTATFTDLDGGNYTFEVQAQTRSGEYENVPTATLSLDVSHPPYKRWWAYLAYLAVLLVAAGFYLRSQRQKIAAIERQNRLSAVERELELTGAVQSGFLPQSTSGTFAGFKYEGFYKPAESCSGDWWWCDDTTSADCCILLVGDVTGHGAGPAMVTAAVATAYRVLDASQSVIERLEVLHREVRRVAAGKYQMTLTAIEFDTRSGDYKIYSAGGLPVLLLNSEAKVRTLVCSGAPLGGEDFNIGSTAGQVNSGDKLLLYTDGIPEIEIAGGKQFGMRRFAKLFKELGERPCDEITGQIALKAKEILGDDEQDDDWTFVVAHWDPQ